MIGGLVERRYTPNGAAAGIDTRPQIVAEGARGPSERVPRAIGMPSSATAHRREVRARYLKTVMEVRDVLSAEALSFVDGLHRELGAERERLLAAREARRVERPRFVHAPE